MKYKQRHSRGQACACWGLNLNDCVSDSASQQGKCRYFLSKRGSELSLTTPSRLSSTLCWAPAAAEPFCVCPLQFVRCSSYVASFVCVGFAKFLSSALSAENTPHPRLPAAGGRVCALRRSVPEPCVSASAAGASVGSLLFWGTLSPCFRKMKGEHQNPLSLRPFFGLEPGSYPEVLFWQKANRNSFFSFSSMSLSHPPVSRIRP